MSSKYAKLIGHGGLQQETAVLGAKNAVAKRNGLLGVPLLLTE